MPIESPEGISFSYEPACLTDRGWAYLLDFLVRAGIVLGISIPLLITLGPAMEAGMGLVFIVFFLVEWFYHVFCEMVMDGQSVGKRVLSLRVVKVAGHPIGFYDSVLRNLLRAADLLPGTYAVATLAVLSTRRFQRLGDLVTDLYLAEGKARERLWKRTAGALEKLEVPATRIEHLVHSDNPALLAALVKERLEKR